MTNWEEKRRNPRAEIKWSAELEMVNQPLTGELKNISVDGAFLSCKQMPNPGQKVKLILKPPDHLQITITAEVIWTTSSPQNGGGVAFTEISEEDKKFIADVVEGNK